MGKLTELAERCEKATGPDYALGREILFACGWTERDYDEIGEEPGTVMVAPDGTVPQQYPQPTHSLDAAMTLVPEGVRLAGLSQKMDGSGWYVHLMHRESREHFEARGDTCALTLCAAAIRARTKNTPDSQRGGA
jgi:hypothetical protein